MPFATGLLTARLLLVEPIALCHDSMDDFAENSFTPLHAGRTTGRALIDASTIPARNPRGPHSTSDMATVL